MINCSSLNTLCNTFLNLLPNIVVHSDGIPGRTTLPILNNWNGITTSVHAAQYVVFNGSTLQIDELLPEFAPKFNNTLFGY